MIKIMRRLQKISGFQKLIKWLKGNERGFVFLELVIGLPLIIILLWSMNSLFTNSWYKCKYMIADFVLQQEMESAMARIVETAKVAYNYDENSETFSYYKFNESNNISSTGKYRYFTKEGKIYRGVTSGNTNPITGDSWIAETSVTKFNCIHKNSKLLYIRFEAESTISKHNIILVTEVYMRGSAP